MRSVSVLSVVSVLLASAGVGGARPQTSEPFVAVAVSYPPGAWAPPAHAGVGASEATRQIRRELDAIKAGGFNSIRTGIDWAAAEPVRGEYRFERFDGLLALAGDAGLKVIVQVDARTGPDWLRRLYPDSFVVPRPDLPRGPSPFTNGYCMDHPGVRADLGAFIGAVTAEAARFPAFYAVDVWRNPGVSATSSARFCYCPYTLARFRDALQRRYRTLPALNASWGVAFSGWAEVHAPASNESTAGSADWQQFFAAKLQEDLKFRSDASAARGARPVTSHADPTLGPGVDDWLMTPVVDHYGASIALPTERPARVLASLDRLRSAARDKSWWLGALSLGREGDGDGSAAAAGAAPGVDLRLWAWAALARGAGSLTFEGWTGAGPQPLAVGGVPDGLRAAAEMAGVVSRNSALFAGLRPHAARVAIVQDPDGGDSLLSVYEAFFDANIQADFIHPDELIAGLSSRYSVVYSGTAVTEVPAVSQALSGFVHGGGTLIMEQRGRPVLHGLEYTLGRDARLWTDANETDPTADAEPSRRPPEQGFPSTARVASAGAGRLFLLSPRESNPAAGMRSRAELLRRVAAAAGATPEIRLDVAGGLVEARFLESSDAMLFVAINYGSVPQKVTFTFAPDVPEAIWQNMETGAAVNFREGPDGPIYTRTLGARDALVLVRGKRLR